MSWESEALCAQVGGDFFFADKQGAPMRDAKSICARCTVKEQCLQWAIDTGTREGVFGGLSPRERRGMYV